MYLSLPCDASGTIKGSSFIWESARCTFNTLLKYKWYSAFLNVLNLCTFKGERYTLKVLKIPVTWYSYFWGCKIFGALVNKPIAFKLEMLLW